VRRARFAASASISAITWPVLSVYTGADWLEVRELARRRYTDGERQRLLDLFGTPERWGQTLRPMLWTHAVAVAPPFNGTTAADLPVPCSYD
jgi:hypothetical protein